jgi:hypothetical protein
LHAAVTCKFEKFIYVTPERKGAGAVKRPGLENLGGSKEPTRVRISPFPLMIITICGSMEFHEKMREVAKILNAAGHTVFMPKSIELMDTIGYVHPTADEEKIRAKIQHDFIREHFRKIEKCDAILVLNYTKKRIKNYIGGNTFLEIGLAYWLGKKIFLLNPIPDMDYMTELYAMKASVLNGDLAKLQ